MAAGQFGKICNYCATLRTQLGLTALFQLLRTISEFCCHQSLNLNLGYLLLSWTNYLDTKSSLTNELMWYGVELLMAVLLLISIWRKNGGLIKLWLGMASFLTILTVSTFFIQLLSPHDRHNKIFYDDWLSITTFFVGVSFHFYQMMLAWDYSFIDLYEPNENDRNEEKFVNRVIEVWRKNLYLLSNNRKIRTNT